MGVLVFSKKPLFAWAWVSLPSVHFSLNCILSNHLGVAHQPKLIHWSLISGDEEKSVFPIFPPSVTHNKGDPFCSGGIVYKITKMKCDQWTLAHMHKHSFIVDFDLCFSAFSSVDNRLMDMCPCLGFLLCLKRGLKGPLLCRRSLCTNTRTRRCCRRSPLTLWISTTTSSVDLVGTS